MHLSARAPEKARSIATFGWWKGMKQRCNLATGWRARFKSKTFWTKIKGSESDTDLGYFTDEAGWTRNYLEEWAQWFPKKRGMIIVDRYIWLFWRKLTWGFPYFTFTVVHKVGPTSTIYLKFFVPPDLVEIFQSIKHMQSKHKAWAVRPTRYFPLDAFFHSLIVIGPIVLRFVLIAFLVPLRLFWIRPHYAHKNFHSLHRSAHLWRCRLHQSASRTLNVNWSFTSITVWTAQIIVTRETMNVSSFTPLSYQPHTFFFTSP